MSRSLRLLLIGHLTAGALALAACSGGSVSLPPLPSPFTPTADQAAVTSIQNVAQQICGFIPAAATVADIVATFTGGGAVVNLVETAARGICSAVTAKGARRSATAPLGTYRGVVIRGDFASR